MCNLSEAIEERGIEKGISLVKEVIRYARKGRTEEEIAELCGISVEKVHYIAEELKLNS